MPSSAPRTLWLALLRRPRACCHRACTREAGPCASASSLSPSSGARWRSVHWPRSGGLRSGLRRHGFSGRRRLASGMAGVDALLDSDTRTQPAASSIELHVAEHSLLPRWWRSGTQLRLVCGGPTAVRGCVQMGRMGPGDGLTEGRAPEWWRRAYHVLPGTVRGWRDALSPSLRESCVVAGGRGWELWGKSHVWACEPAPLSEGCMLAEIIPSRVYAADCLAIWPNRLSDGSCAGVET